MLSMTYKLLTKLLALQLRKLLPKLINDWQTGFIPGCQILENISITCMALKWATLTHNHALYLKLDFKKAFDRVDFNYIWATLTTLGLGGKFFQLMQGVILGGSIKNHINGQFLVEIPLSQGVR